jgi:hypothetical protein
MLYSLRRGTPPDSKLPAGPKVKIGQKPHSWGKVQCTDGPCEPSLIWEAKVERRDTISYLFHAGDALIVAHVDPRARFLVRTGEYKSRKSETLQFGSLDEEPTQPEPILFLFGAIKQIAFYVVLLSIAIFPIRCRKRPRRVELPWPAKSLNEFEIFVA